MTVLRVYRPPECDERGVPLDYERCRHCGGSGIFKYTSVGYAGRPTCHVCGGHGSLKAATLAEVLTSSRYRNTLWPRFDPKVGTEDPVAGMEALSRAGAAMDAEPARCEGCGHPMSDGTWEGPAAELLLDPEHPFTAAEAEREWLEMEAFKRAPEGQRVRHNVNFWSPCDEGCRHEGPGRWRGWRYDEWQAIKGTGTTGVAIERASIEVEASWRTVDVRTLSWAHDLRSEELAVLCLRCFVERTST